MEPILDKALLRSYYPTVYIHTDPVWAKNTAHRITVRAKVRRLYEGQWYIVKCEESIIVLKRKDMRTEQMELMLGETEALKKFIVSVHAVQNRYVPNMKTVEVTGQSVDMIDPCQLSEEERLIEIEKP